MRSYILKRKRTCEEDTSKTVTHSNMTRISYESVLRVAANRLFIDKPNSYVDSDFEVPFFLSLPLIR